ncbi:hypothetical protein NKI25_11220 [Mesorhizobium sp. M0808]|uniref:hypothetical protein n=1 Tax=Mesorhizobium sp. M0808 TaxID=2957002 RepID=UPI00333AD3A3
MVLMKYAATILVVLSSCYGTRGAECPLDGYDSTPPTAQTGKIVLNGEDLVYASDVERTKDQTFIWNYVKNNNQERGVSVSWPKGSISFNIINPLAAGAIACAIYNVDGAIDDHIDYEAIIKYGNANYEQRASAYTPVDHVSAKNESAASKVSLTYDSEEGKKNVSLEFSFKMEDNRIVDMGLSASDGYYVGIMNANEYWSDATTKSFYDIANKNKLQTAYSSWGNFAQDPVVMKAFLDRADLNDNAALFANGTINGFGFGELVSSIRQSDVVIFDSKKQPVFSTRIALPVTRGP